jgi:hypothetical protein
MGRIKSAVEMLGKESRRMMDGGAVSGKADLVRSLPRLPGIAAVQPRRVQVVYAEAETAVISLVSMRQGRSQQIKFS